MIRSIKVTLRTDEFYFPTLENLSDEELKNFTRAFIYDHLTEFEEYVKRQRQRVDPPGCGCVDCLTGYSRPAS